MNNVHEIRMERVRLLYQQSPGLLGGSFFSGTAIFLFVLLQELASNIVVLYTWYLCLMVLIAVRIGLLIRFNKISATDFDVNKWIAYFTVAVIGSGLIVGLSPFLFVDLLDPISIAFLSFVIFGTLSGSLAALSNFKFIYYLFGILSISPLAILFYNEGGALVYMSFLLVVFMAAHLFFANNLYKSIVLSIEQRFINLDLVKKLEAQTILAEQASIDKSRFLAATSHDLRQPLHSLGLFLTVLKSRLHTEEHLGILIKAQRSQDVLAGQLNSIIEMTQMDAGEIYINPENFWLNDFVEEIVEDFKLLAEQKNIIIKTRLADCYVNYDPILLGRIIRNLMSNAIQHCPRSKLLIALRCRNSVVELSFIDSGPGISLKNQERVFSEFFQLSNPERDRNKGMGLGLAIVKRLSDLLDIPIQLSSREGKGSCFKLTLNPAVPDVKHEASEIDATLNNDFSASNLSGRFIVVVDDDSTILGAMRDVLLLWGCEVLLAASQQELLEVLVRDNYPKPDLLIVDYRLGEDATGIDAIKAVRTFFNKSISAVIISGDTTLGIESKIDIDKTRVFYKPLSGSLFKAVLLESLE